MKPAAGLKLTLLGGFQAQLEAGAALVLPTRKAQALLAYLAVPLGQAHPREKLATLLWGDMQDAQARGNLRYALSRIRKALPRSVRPGLVLDGPSVALDPKVVDVDVARAPATTDVDPQGRARRKRRYSPGYSVREIANLWMIPASSV